MLGVCESVSLTFMYILGVGGKCFTDLYVHIGVGTSGLLTCTCMYILGAGTNVSLTYMYILGAGTNVSLTYMYILGVGTRVSLTCMYMRGVGAHFSSSDGHHAAGGTLLCKRALCGPWS